jgi:carboxyl-terminal processing protease
MAVAVALLTACAGPQASQPARSGPAPTAASAPPEYRLLKGFTEALWIVQSQYLQPVETRPLIVLALRGADRQLRSRGVSIHVSDQGVTVAHRAPGAPQQTVTLPLPPPDPTTPVGDVDVVANAVAFLEGRPGIALDEVRDALIHGLMDADPEGSYLELKRQFEVQGVVRGDIAAAGLDFTRRDGTLTVIGAVDGAPAFRAGVQPGDRVVKIDGVPTKETSLPDVARGMRGVPGSKVTLSVIRDGWAEPKDIQITREQIRLLPVSGEDLGQGIVHVKLREFQTQTPRDLVQLLARHEKDGMKGVILDLRNTPGGAVTAAVEVAELFLDDGRLVAYTESRVKKNDTRYSATAKKGYRTLPLAVLVNHGTSAGSEIVAGALQDWSRAQLIGTRTFGRASIQTIIPLADGTALRLTTGEWFTPKGRSVRAQGLTPDITVVAADAQLASALARVRSLIPGQGR